jgi:hypothetical protein
MNWATPKERSHLGQARRKQVGRQEHSIFNPKARKTPPLALLQRSMRGRVPALIQLKYELMSQSPFGYFRGAVPVMAADLSVLPATGLISQLCGDAHVRNLGAYAAPDGRLVFDINDFDETIRGPFEWDLKRMAASITLAGRGSGHKDSCSRDAIARPLRSTKLCSKPNAPLRNTLLKRSLNRLTNQTRSAASNKPHPCSPASPAPRPHLSSPRSLPTARCWSRSASIFSPSIAPSQ